MKISIIIPHYNNVALLKKCLASLIKNTPAEYLDDVIIIDDVSKDDSVVFLETVKWIKLIVNKTNQGFAKNCNRGAKESKGDVLLFLNNDTEVLKKWLEPMLDLLKKNEVGIVGSKLIFPDGMIQHAGVVISNDHMPRHIYHHEDPAASYVNKTREFQAVTAACMAIKKDVFNAVSGFDEEYINGMEDIDLCHKVTAKGYKIFYTPESVITHHESVSPGRFKHNNKNNELYLSRWSHIKPDEQQYYKEDRRSWFYRVNKELNNKYYGYYYSQRPFYLQMPRYFYMVAQKTSSILRLFLKGELKTIIKKIFRVSGNVKS
ncbi:TPA: glycosyltransferase family 2 protein [candidate division CPR2 bacterium]|uniref:Glycosyl transferase family 2 n=1 Tax=candidate division CPR2 bacterium GW2011_GWC1_41_48 TaxID=1618344 RepID=A0A0G0YJB5_UNCC2|nr:MAG: Glycosyl transferase family 2 [candidate division CPR2 bacterium GW2011_GWC2_39_35]KKR27844.1 MAG: Glycosyl transferase family 2 [candidate division CPR2 bacterium GW2011_GWD1_39_7]KKR28742.1 MAG: Glycosyl transferase family 2 [candidate division CPR2 bacterium GW2011_GWD2_39_7]KKS09601.1 MAG: Glycosyl transferase family 2 [candidate division CPR2 bacterium GW2011_GWC1_41_48]OGB59969.1 MAG: hypothetical protein A2Y27_00280 [candidate division CPR2 bacterium GWD1_39_7]OGB73133.1 MAG: hy